MPKTENKTGRNFSTHDRNNPVDYKKVRRDVFQLVEQLICSNTILTASLQHNETLQRKCLARIQDMKAKITDVENKNDELEVDWNFANKSCHDRELENNELKEIIVKYEKEKHEWLGAKEYRKSKTEVN